MRWHLIDRLVACRPGESAVAVKRFPRSTPLFEDHFPGWPTVPGVLLIEMIAATGGKALRLAWPDRWYVLAAVKGARFHRRIEPEEECRITVRITQNHARRAAAEGLIEVGGERACQATVLYGVRPETVTFDDPVLADWSRRHSPSGGELPNP